MTLDATDSQAGDSGTGSTTSGGGDCSINVLIAMTSLSFAAPRHGEGPERLAAWYRAKAALHELLAEQDCSDAEREKAFAAKALEKSRRLLLGHASA
jgi:hypothetical protein